VFDFTVGLELATASAPWRAGGVERCSS